MDNQQSTRTAYTAGLRQLADWLDVNPHLPLPYTGSDPQYSPLHFIVVTDPGQRETVAAFARALPGPVEKVPDYTPGQYLLRASFSGLHVTVIADRAEVCDRVVGGQQCTTQVPA